MEVGKKVFYLALAALFVYISLPLILPIAMGGVFAVLCAPALHWLERRKIPTALASLIITLSFTLVFLVPVGLLVFLAAKTGLAQLRSLRGVSNSGEGDFFENLIHQPAVVAFLGKVSKIYPVADLQDLITATQDLLRSAALKSAEVLGDFFGNLPTRVLALVIVVLSVYFLLADGRKLDRFVRKLSTFSPGETDRLIKAFVSMCRSVILATVASGFAQAILMMIVCVIAGVPSVALIGFMVFICSFLPLVGSAPITFSLAGYQILTGNRSAGIILLVGAIIVGLVDNVIRPLVLKGSANLHPLLAFVAAFGGLKMLGFSGVFLGPIIAGLFVVSLQILDQLDGLRHAED